MESMMQFWKTTTGKLIFGGGLLSGLLMLCAVCAVYGLVFGTSDETADEISSKAEEAADVVELADAAEATDTPEPASTPVPSVTPEPTHTPEPSPTNTMVVPPTEPPPPGPASTNTPMPPPPPSPAEASAAPPPLGGPVTIINVNDGAEYVEIQNTSDTPVDLGGWRLFSERGAQNCDLGGVIQPGQVLRIWALSADGGKDGFNCGFETNIWNNFEQDSAILYDPSGAEVSRMD